MDSIWDIPYIVVDVETTGSDAKKNRIIDIACVTSLGGKIVSQYHSLVNPHQLIPEFIIDMTGISNNMVYRAPEPDEVFPNVQKILRKEKAVFAAHNASFDYGFVKSNFELYDIEFPDIKKLCTFKLAKRLLPNLQKRNVGFLAAYFGIPVKGRHRAYGDAQATAHILHNLLEIAYQEHNINTIDELISFQNEPMHKFKAPVRSFKFVKERLEELPEEPGVYYFRDEDNNLLYIGKAKYLKDRVRSYFALENPNSKKISEMIKKIRKIDWTCTGTELAALLLETKEIKEHKPPYNTMDKVYRNYPFIKLTLNEDYPRVISVYEIENDGAEYYGPFRSFALVEDTIQTIEKQFKIIKCDLNINKNTKIEPCFFYHIKQCGAPCDARQSMQDYAYEVSKVKNYLSGYPDGVIDKLSAKMTEFSDNMNFEQAARIRDQIMEMRRVFERQKIVPTSINQNNLILVLPATISGKNAEVFFIKSGKLKFQKTLADLDIIDDTFEELERIYFSGQKSEFPYSQADIKEMKIITSWAFSVREYAAFVYLEGKTKDEIKRELVNAYFKISNGEVIDNDLENDY